MNCSPEARKTLVHAARLLEVEARAIKRCATVNGRWPSDDRDALAAYIDYTTTAAKLRILLNKD